MVIGVDFKVHVGEGKRGNKGVIKKFGVLGRNVQGQMVVGIAKSIKKAAVKIFFFFQKRHDHRVS